MLEPLDHLTNDQPAAQLARQRCLCWERGWEVRDRRASLCRLTPEPTFQGRTAHAPLPGYSLPCLPLPPCPETKLSLFHFPAPGLASSCLPTAFLVSVSHQPFTLPSTSCWLPHSHSHICSLAGLRTSPPTLPPLSHPGFSWPFISPFLELTPLKLPVPEAGTSKGDQSWVAPSKPGLYQEHPPPLRL